MDAVVIGASAGAIDALLTLLPALPENFRLPVMVVIHLPGDQKSLLAELFSDRVLLDVCEPDDKEKIMPGVIYFAPPNYHLMVEHDRCFSLSNEEPVNYSRPSIDVFFESAADVYQSGLIGIILTGANSDGSAGLRHVIDRGGKGVVQAPATAASPEMPQAAIATCPEARIMDLTMMSKYLRELE